MIIIVKTKNYQYWKINLKIMYNENTKKIHIHCLLMENEYQLHHHYIMLTILIPIKHVKTPCYWSVKFIKYQQVSKQVLSNTVYSDQEYCACNYKIQVLHIDTNRRNGGKKNKSTRKLRKNAGEWWRREKMQWPNKCCARNGYHKCHEVISNAKIAEWQK